MRGDRGGTPSLGRVSVVGLTALGVAMGIGRFAFTPILPMMQQDSSVSIAEGGWLATANYAGYLVGAISAWVIRTGPATAIRLGLAGTAVATLAMAVDSGFEARLALRALAGISSAWVLVFASSWSLARLAPYRRPLLSGMVFAGVGIGIALAGGVCLALMEAGAGSSAAWVSLGLIALIATAVIWRSVGASDAGGLVESEPPVPPPWRWSGGAARLVCCYGGFGFGYIIPATFVPVLARQMIPDPAIFGWCWPMFGAAAAASTLGAGAAMRWAGARRIWMISQLLMALGVCLPVAGRGVVPIVLAALLVGGTFMVNTMAGMQEARRLAAANPTPLMASLTTAFALGQIVGPILVSSRVGPDEDFTEPLLLAALVLAASTAGLALPASRRCPARGCGV
jgi:predicted MFS family arabinose efflux permease